MRNLTEDQKNLVLEYEDFNLQDLYNLIANTVAESDNIELRQRYTLGEPNLYKRGQHIVADVRSTICSKREQFEQIVMSHKDVLDPLDWAATIIDLILLAPIMAGVPPWTVACALGKLCNYSLKKLCPLNHDLR